MRGTNRHTHHSGAAAKIKRKRFEHHHKNRKRKLVTESETLISLEPKCVTISNSFLPIRSSFDKKRRRSKKLSSSVSNRNWVVSSRNFSSFKDRVVVVSYNILGVENALKHPDLYLDVPAEFLEWERRKELICDEVNRYNAGIICFQEVDRFDDLDYHLRKDGLKGVYKARTGEACDGCATFWKDELFTLLHEESIEFQRLGLRNNVAQFCVLKMKNTQSEWSLCKQESKKMLTPSRSLVVGNIHVLFNPNRGDIKLGQVRLFLEKAYKLSQEWGGIPVVLGGDLNSIPQSAIYQFVASSELNVLQYDRRNISGQLGVERTPTHRRFRFHNENMTSVPMSTERPLIYRWSDEELRIATGSERITHLCHRLKLCSAYHGVSGNTRSRATCGEPLATSYHSKFMGTVDYIWHTEDLVPMRVLETLPIKILRRSAGLPNERWGSDHLALVCELGFEEDGDI